MATFIVGPSCVGKSTFIQHNATGAEVVFGHQVASRGVSAGETVHYNLLHHAQALHKAAGTISSEWDLFDDASFAEAIRSGQLTDAVVLVAPIAELRERMTSRKLIEPTLESPGQYPNRFRLDVLDSVDLFACYEQLFDTLDGANIPYRVVFSSAEVGTLENPQFLPSDRVSVHHNLRGLYLSQPSDAEIDGIISMPGCEHQSVLLPKGRLTQARNYGHVGDGRGDTF